MDSGKSLLNFLCLAHIDLSTRENTVAKKKTPKTSEA